MKWGRGDVETSIDALQPSLQDEPTPAIDGDGDAAATEEPATVSVEEVAVPEPLVENKVEEEVLEVVNVEETTLEEVPAPVTVAPPPPVDDAAVIEDVVEPAIAQQEQDQPDLAHLTTTTPAPNTNKPEPSIKRKASHYSPPVAKAIKVVKRSELKRQLNEQRATAPVTTTTTTTNNNSVPALSGPALPSKRSSNPSGNGTKPSRGSRLISMAHDKAPLAIVSMALAPPTKTPRAAFGLDEAIITPPARSQQQQQPQAEGEEENEQPENNTNCVEQAQGGDEHVAAATGTTVETPVEETETQVDEEKASPVDESAAEEVVDEEEEPAAPAAAIATAAAVEGAAAVQPTSGVSGSPLSLALWNEPSEPAEESTEKATEPKESLANTDMDVVVRVALGAAMAEVAIGAGGNGGDVEKENEDEAVAMEIDHVDAPAPVEEATPLPETEEIVQEEEALPPAPVATAAQIADEVEVVDEEQVEDAVEEEEQIEDEEEAKDAAVLIDGGQGNQFTPLPRLLPRWGISSGGDSAATSPSSFCSLLPAGLSGGRNPVYKISKPGATAPAAANSPSVALRSHKSNSGKDDDNDDMNDGAASTYPHDGEGTGRRVRFFGVEEISKEEEENVDQQELLLLAQQQQQDGDGEQREVVCRPSMRPLPPPVCRPSSANGRTHLTGAQPRFGIGAFVRIPATTTTSNNTNNNAAAVQQSSEDASPPDAAPASAPTVENGGASPSVAAASATVVGNDDTSPPANILQISIEQETATPLIITRRLQHSGTLLRRAAALLPPLPAGESVPQLLREAFLNARLAEHWCRGEAWARLDLSGIELVRDGDREAHLNAVIATLTGQRGDSAVQTALDQLQIEWEHLKCFRQKYVSSPTEKGTVATTAAPKSILKHASGVSPLAAIAGGGGGSGGGANDHTPPLDRNLPGFEDILAAEVVPGSTSPRDWAIGALGAIAAGNHTGQLTPGIMVRSRGIKMLASLHHQAAAATAAAAAVGSNGAPQEGANDPGTGQTTDAVGGGAVATRAATAAAAAAAAAEEQQRQGQSNNAQQQQPAAVIVAGERRRRSSNGTRRGGSRGHRLLQALQNAAGPAVGSGGGVAGNVHGAPSTAAAAAARLIVDSSTAGGDGGDFMTGPMATSFVVG